MQSLKSLLLKFLHLLVGIRDAFAAVLAALIGDWHWSAPAWVRAMQRLAQALVAKIRAQPRASAVTVGLIAIVLGGGYAAWQWYQHLPKPVEIEFTVQAPARTCYECEPAGKPNPVVVHFSGSVAKLEAAGKPVAGSKAGLEISPAAAGQWSWDDDKTLRFQPQEDWPIAASYTVTFAKKGFVADHIHLKDYSFNFDTPAFAAKIANTEFYQDPVNAGEKRVVVTVNFSHAVDPAEFEQRIGLTLFNKVADNLEQKIDPAPKFTVVYDKLKLNAFIHSEQLSVPSKEGRAQVDIDKGVRAARGGNKTEQPMTASVTVPGLYSLRVKNLHLDIVRDEKDEPSQVMMLETAYSVLEKDITAKTTVLLLPPKHPDAKTQAEWERYNKEQPYNWSASSVTPQVLAQAEKLPVEYVPNEREHVEFHSFRYKADPGRAIYVKVDKGLRSFGGYLMADAEERVLRIPDYPKELRIASQGSLLAMSGSHKLTVFTRGDIPALRVQVGRLLPNQIQHLVTQFGGDFSKPAPQNWNFDVSNITERHTRIIRLPKSPPGTAHYEPVDLGEFLAKDSADRRGIFLLKIEAYDPKTQEVVQPQDRGDSDEQNSPDDSGGYGSYSAQLNDTRMVVVTDLGLIVKKAVNGSQDVFVQSIVSGEPVAGVNVDVIGKNGESVLSQTTDAGGHAHFADLKSFKNEKAPALYLARRGGDSSFMPIGTRVHSLDLSRFDVGGVANSTDKNKLTAFVFSDRGIYRPGDEVRAGLIIKSQDWSKPLKGVPLMVEVSDPRGQTLKKERIALSAAGFEEFRFVTRDTSPTGEYTLNVYIPKDNDSLDLIGSLQVKVQEFLPDRLKMAAHLSSEVSEGWVSPDALKASVSLQNLFGTPAENRRVTAKMTLSPSFPAFARYRDYQFTDPLAAKEGFENALPDAKTDDKGEATFDLNLQRFARATYRLHLVAEGFEPDGGRGVSAEAAQLVSSLPYLIGYKADGDLGYVSRGTQRTVRLLAIDPKAQPTAVKGLTLTRIERKYVSMLLKQDNGTYKYESRVKEVKLDDRPYELAAKGDSLTLDTAAPGNFAYVVADKDGQAYTRIEYSVAGSANLTRSLEKNAELQITLNRKDYAAGDEIEMQIQAPYTGSGLITIERDKVYAYRWFKASTTSSTQKIRVPEELEGNAYVSVSFVRDPGSEEIYMSPLSYGVRPFSIALDQRRNAITLNVPDKVKPGDVLKLRYKTAKLARIVLFAVDEGILQVARYQTPDPLGHFFQKRSLDVDTRQILDLILPEFRQLGMAAPGGDGEAALGRHLNPFKRKTDKPVAWWSGIVDADSTERELSYTVPDYFNGTLRLMAVAVSENDIGVTEGKSLVRGDFVLSPNVPTTVTPGDEFDVSVGIANNAEGSGKDAPVMVSVDPSMHLEVIGDKSATLKISELHESVAHFKIRARDELGSATLQFGASWQNKSGKLAATMSVRPATPYMTLLNAGSFTNSHQDVPVTRNLYPHFRKLEAGVSVLPLGLAHGLSSYLGGYPYSCTEQLVSQAMPAIVLGARPEFGYLQNAPGASLQGLIEELRSRQNADGSYRYWAGVSKVEEFVSIYVQHVLLEAVDHGQGVPRDLINSGNAYLRGIAQRDGNNLDDERDTAYAIYLLTRQGNVMANEAGALQKRLQERYKDQWQGDIAAAWLAASYKLMKQDSLANKAIAKVNLGGTHAVSHWHDGMTSDAELLYVLAQHFPERLQKLPADFLDLLVKRIQNGEYHSLSAATTILALDAYAKTAGDMAAGKLGISEILRDGKTVRDLPLPGGVLPRLEFSPEAGKLRFGNDSDLRAFWLMSQSGFDRKPPAEAIKNGFEIIREYTDADGKVLTNVKLGQQVDVHIKFRAINRDAINDAVLVDLLPGGFEMVIPREKPAPQEHLEAATSEDEAQDGGDNAQDAGCICSFLFYRPNGFPDNAEMREDRVIVYGRVSGDVQEFRYRIKATNLGSFTVPPAYGESMYERQVQARSLAGRITVEAP
jgi:uncharacterized protein YfaS (alpha-2-macroglobulin family)